MLIIFVTRAATIAHYVKRAINRQFPSTLVRRSILYHSRRISTFHFALAPAIQQMYVFVLDVNSIVECD